MRIKPNDPIPKNFEQQKKKSDLFFLCMYNQRISEMYIFDKKK